MTASSQPNSPEATPGCHQGNQSQVAQEQRQSLTGLHERVLALATACAKRCTTPRQGRPAPAFGCLSSEVA